MEADNVLSDQVQIRRPELLVLLRAVPLRVIAYARDIVGQGVQPHIYHMPGVKIHRDPPLKGRPGHAQILQARQQEIVHHLVFPGHGLDKFRMLVNVLYQPVRIFAHAEEIRLLPGGLHLPAAVGAFSVHKLGFCPEGLTGRAVHSLIGSLVDISLVIELLKYLLHLGLMNLVRGADKLVIGSVQQIAHSLNDPRHLVHKLLGRHPCLLGLQLDLLSMLVGSCLVKDIIAFLPLKPGDTVRHHNLIVVAYMGFPRGIGDCCGNIILSLLLHLFSAPSAVSSESPGTKKPVPHCMPCTRRRAQCPCYHFFSSALHRTDLFGSVTLSAVTGGTCRSLIPAGTRCAAQKPFSRLLPLVPLSCRNLLCKVKQNVLSSSLPFSQ